MTAHLPGTPPLPAPLAPPPNSLGGTAAPKVSERGRAGLELLLEAHCFAQELDRSVWDFALEVDRLRIGGLVFNDLRWLVCKGYLEHASEILSDAGAERRFHKGGALTFTETSCFVLTEAGKQFVQSLCQQGPDNPLPHGSLAHDPPALDRALAPGETHVSPRGNIAALNGKSYDPPPPWLTTPSPLPQFRPRWDRDRQELRLGDFLVKQFKVPAPNQETVIAVFQEEGWPPRIDDPLPPRADLDPKRRLHDTINSLNRNQKTPLLRFLGDGSGQGVRWEPTTPLPPTNQPPTRAAENGQDTDG